MLDMHPNCQLCDTDLRADKDGAMICSFECTFCRDCVSDSCPNCGGQLSPRPMRTGAALQKYPASTQRILNKP